jgi:hypothetical protein
MKLQGSLSFRLPSWTLLKEAVSLAVRNVVSFWLGDLCKHGIDLKKKEKNWSSFVEPEFAS